MLGDVDGYAKLRGKQGAEGRADSQTAGEGTLPAQGNAGGKDAHTPGDGEKHARGDVRRGCPPGKQADDFRFRKDGAHAGNGDGLAQRGGFSQRGEIHAEDPGKNLEKPAGSGGAFIVHKEILYGPVRIGADDLAVLSADIEDKTGFRKEMDGAGGMAADFRRDIMRRGKGNAAVAGGCDMQGNGVARAGTGGGKDALSRFA